jgi:hypothetical protein
MKRSVIPMNARDVRRTAASAAHIFGRRHGSGGRHGARRAATQTFLAALALVATGAPAMAQDTYPNRPVKIIAPQAPGGGVDLVGAHHRRQAVAARWARAS